MQINDVYICSTELIPLPENDNSRLVVVRGFSRNKVKFSICCDKQPNLCLGARIASSITFYNVKFLLSAFTVDRSFFEEFFEPIGYVVPF